MVRVLTRHPAAWKPAIDSGVVVRTADTIWESKGDFHGCIAAASSDAADVVPQADIVVFSTPAHATAGMLEVVAPHTKDGVWIGTLFAQGGFNWAARKAFGDRIVSEIGVA